MRNLKVFGLALAAVLAMSGIAASVAPADQVTAESYPTTLTGVTDSGTVPQFLTTAGTVSCDKTAYTVTLTVSVVILTATVHFDIGKGTVAGVPAKIDSNGCGYQFNVG